MVVGLADAVPLWAAMLLWLVLWVLYLSIVNVGQIWYSFGWESLLLEAGLLVVFVGNDEVAPSGARDVVDPLAAVPRRVRRGADQAARRPLLARSDVSGLPPRDAADAGPAQLVLPSLATPVSPRGSGGQPRRAARSCRSGCSLPQPIASVAAAIIAATQFWLVLSGNFSWLNWLTIVLAAQRDRHLDRCDGARCRHPRICLRRSRIGTRASSLAFAALVVVRSWYPARNLVSRRQRMNSSFDPLRLVNTYGAFGSISRIRDEVILEGTDAVRPVRRNGMGGIRIQGQAR